jgi:Na+/melibiose symporter-like transporter
MRFVDFLRATVLLSGGAATTLAVLTLVAATRENDNDVALYATIWWVVATLIGTWVGRRNEVNPPIARLLADARTGTMMPDIRPGLAMVNRLWPLFLVVLAAAALTWLGPQIPGIAAGFTIIWALAWRRQESAVAAIEERDGVTFFVERTSPVRPMQLIRLPGFRRERPTINGVGPS